jgi:hypothetical protein
LRAYKRYQLDNLELAHLTPFNPTIIKKNIHSFLQENNKRNAFIAFSLDGPAVTEHCIALPTSTPHRADFGIAHSSNMLWEYRYLYPNDHGQFIFYVYMVPRSLVLQYQLLAIATQCNLITITTQNMALLTAYKHIFGAAFRRSQFGIDMMRRNNRFDLLISNDALRRMVATSSAGVALENERVNIATACGLFFDERIV